MQINGVDLNVKISGEGVPFIYAHGLMASMAADDYVNWIKWDQLSDVIKLVRYDARGHGQSGHSDNPADYRWSELQRDMLAVADAVGFDKFVAGGQSMGCGTTLHAALAAPERMKGLVLVTPPTAWETRTAQAGVYTQMADVIDNKGTDFLLGMMAQQPAAAPAWQVEAYQNMMQDFAESLKRFDPHVLSTVLRGAALANLPPVVELEKLKMPTLILAWVDDPGHPVSSSQEIERRMPQSRLMIAHNAAEVGEWTDAIRQFVTALD